MSLSKKTKESTYLIGTTVQIEFILSKAARGKIICKIFASLKINTLRRGFDEEKFIFENSKWFAKTSYFMF